VIAASLLARGASKIFGSWDDQRRHEAYVRRFRLVEFLQTALSFPSLPLWGRPGGGWLAANADTQSSAKPRAACGKKLRQNDDARRNSAGRYWKASRIDGLGFRRQTPFKLHCRIHGLLGQSSSSKSTENRTNFEERPIRQTKNATPSSRRKVSGSALHQRPGDVELRRVVEAIRQAVLPSKRLTPSPTPPQGGEGGDENSVSIPENTTGIRAHSHEIHALWLKEHLTPTSAGKALPQAHHDRARDREYRGQGEGGWSRYAARVISAERHPNRGSLAGCWSIPARLSAGAGGVRRAERRATASSACSRPPALHSGKHITLGVGTIRGVEKPRQLCSRRGTSPRTTDGIMELPESMRRSQGLRRVGRPWRSRIEINLTPNRQTAPAERHRRDLSAATWASH